MYFKQMNGLFTLDDFYLIPMATSVIVSIKSFTKHWQVAFCIFCIFLVLTLLFEFFAIVWLRFLHVTSYWNFSKSNLWIYNVSFGVRFPLLILYFSYFNYGSQVKKIFHGLNILYVLFFLVNICLWQKPDFINIHTLLMANVLIVFQVIYFFRWVVKNNQLIRLSHATEIWIALGTFIYYSGTVPLFLAINYFNVVDEKLMSSLLHINDVLNIVMYTSYAIAFLCKPKFQI